MSMTVTLWPFGISKHPVNVNVWPCLLDISKKQCFYFFKLCTQSTQVVISQMLLTLLGRRDVLALSKLHVDAYSCTPACIHVHMSHVDSRVGHYAADSTSPAFTVQYKASEASEWHYTHSGAWTHSHTVKWPESHREGSTNMRGLWWGFLSESLFSHLSQFWPLPMLWPLHGHVHNARTHLYLHTYADVDTNHAARWQLNLLEMTGHVGTSHRAQPWPWGNTTRPWTPPRTHTVRLLWTISRAISPSMPPGLGSISQRCSEPEENHWQLMMWSWGKGCPWLWSRLT